ncbi:MAG: hypothetical protein ABJ015_04000, partial [Rhodopirellula bahusiensis]
MSPLQSQTIQGFDVREFKDRLDPTRGKHANDPKIWPALRRLYGIVDTDQFLWCSQTALQLNDESNRYLHKITVDERDIITVINSLHWCQIIGYQPRYIPPDEHAGLRDQAVFSEDDYDDALKRIEDEYLAKNRSDHPW